MRRLCGKQAVMLCHLCSEPKGDSSYSHCCDFLCIPAQGDWHLHSGSAACSESHSLVSDSRHKGFDRTWPHWECNVMLAPRNQVMSFILEFLRLQRNQSNQHLANKFKLMGFCFLFLSLSWNFNDPHCVSLIQTKINSFLDLSLKTVVKSATAWRHITTNV